MNMIEINLNLLKNERGTHEGYVTVHRQGKIFQRKQRLGRKKETGKGVIISLNEIDILKTEAPIEFPILSSETESITKSLNNATNLKDQINILLKERQKSFGTKNIKIIDKLIDSHLGKVLGSREMYDKIITSIDQKKFEVFYGDVNKVSKGNMTQLNKFINTKINKNIILSNVKLNVTPDEYVGAYYNGVNTIFVGAGTMNMASIIHEFGHHLEDSNRKIKEKILNFFRDRTKNQSPKRISKRGQSYEIIPDKFLDPYMGRLYYDGATEILSLGLEFISSPKKYYKLMVKDPEYFSLIMDIIRGQL